jgi:hypothetical protein
VTWRPRAGDLFVALDLVRPDALGGVADPNRALNRHVRPALRALSSIELIVSGDARKTSAALMDAYSNAANADISRFESIVGEPPLPSLAAPPFDATVDEAIGVVGASIESSRVVLGGDFMASRDVIATLGDRLSSLGPEPSDESLGAAIDEALGPRSGALFFGVRSLKSVATVVREAWRRHAPLTPG